MRARRIGSAQSLFFFFFSQRHRGKTSGEGGEKEYMKDPSAPILHRM